MPLLLLVQQVGGGGDKAQPPPCLHRERQGRGATALCITLVAPSCKERWRRAHGSYTAATTQPAAGLGPWLSRSAMGMVLCSGWGHREGAGDTGVPVPCPRSPLLWPSPGQEAWGAAGPCSPFLRDVPTACTVSTWRYGASGTRHVCVFPGRDVRLFTQLHLRVLDTTTNQTKYWRELSVDAVGESLPLGNIPVTPGQSLDLSALSLCLPRGAAAPCTLGTETVLGGPLGIPQQDQGVPDRACHRRANTPAHSPQVSSPPQ